MHLGNTTELVNNALAKRNEDIKVAVVCNTDIGIQAMEDLFIIMAKAKNYPYIKLNSKTLKICNAEFEFIESKYTPKGSAYMLDKAFDMTAPWAKL